MVIFHRRTLWRTNENIHEKHCSQINDNDPYRQVRKWLRRPAHVVPLNACRDPKRLGADSIEESPATPAAVISKASSRISAKNSAAVKKKILNQNRREMEASLFKRRFSCTYPSAAIHAGLLSSVKARGSQLGARNRAAATNDRR